MVAMVKIPLLLVVSFLARAAPELSDRIKITEVKGPAAVSVQRAVGGKQEEAREGDELRAGDEVGTTASQLVSLEAYDGSKWKVAPNSQLRLESRKPEKQNFFYWTFQLLRGSMWGKVEKSSEGGSGFRLKTRTKLAAMGVRGTEYLMMGDDTHSELDVLEGKVWWGRSAGFEPGTFQEVSAGGHAEIWANGKTAEAKSEGDAVALQRHYGLLPPLAGESGSSVKNKESSPDDCRARGKAWCSKNGSKAGECCKD